MKIYLIGQKGIPSISGGVEKHVEDLSSCLARQGHEVFVYTRFNYTSRKLKEYKRVRLIPLPSLPTKHLDAISHTFFACLHVIFKRKVDVVHFHSIGPCFWLWLVKLFKPRTKVVATFHSQCYHHQKWGRLARLSLKIGERVCVKYSDEIVVVSKVLKTYVKEKYGRDAHYIPNGVPPASFFPPDSINKNWGLGEKDYILSVSRLVRHKGIHYLIKAFKGLDTDKKLVIVGDSANTDDYVAEVKELAKDDKRIILTGVQSGVVLKELFTNAYAFAQPSESEGLSIALLESMSYSLPVVSSDIKENKEALADGAVFFENKNYKDLREKLKYILERPDLAKELGEKNKLRASQEYSWENIVQELVQVYSE